LADRLDIAQATAQAQRDAREAADHDYEQGEAAYQAKHLEAAMTAYRAALSRTVHDEARTIMFQAAVQRCEKAMKTSAYVLGEIQLTFKETTEAFAANDVAKHQPLIPWNQPTTPKDKPKFKFQVSAIVDGRVQGDKPVTVVPKMCTCVINLHARVAKTFKGTQRMFSDEVEVSLLGPTFVAIMESSPATWPAMTD
jgi:hypothetical protein